MIKVLTNLIKWLDKVRLVLIFHHRRKQCKCLCRLCTVEDCEAKGKIADLSITE